MWIEPDQPTRPDIAELLAEHLADMHATSPPDSIHALDHDGLAASAVTLWAARDHSTLLGIAALKQLSVTEGEVKSMRTTRLARNRGVATELLCHVLDEARRRGYQRIYLETGTQDFFAPARRLYRRHGFAECPPFADYRLDPNSVFMTFDLQGVADESHNAR
jgi:putative acetyltransferase